MSYNAMGNDYTNQFDTQDVADNKVISVLAYIPLLFWLPLVTGTKSRFGRFHANQGLILLLLYLVFVVANAIIGLIFGWIPIVGGIISGLVSLVLWALELALMIYGMVNTGNGRAKQLPIVGSLITIIQ